MTVRSRSPRAVREAEELLAKMTRDEKAQVLYMRFTKDG